MAHTARHLNGPVRRSGTSIGARADSAGKKRKSNRSPLLFRRSGVSYDWSFRSACLGDEEAERCAFSQPRSMVNHPGSPLLPYFGGDGRGLRGPAWTWESDRQRRCAMSGMNDSTRCTRWSSSRRTEGARWFVAMRGHPGYCVEGLRMSEGTAGRRVTAARVCRRSPEVFERVARGELHLCALCALAPHLNEQNAGELFEASKGKTRRQIEEMLAVRFPRPDVREQIRRLPARGQALTHSAINGGVAAGPSLTRPRRRRLGRAREAS
jgi:hypothetical protein